MTLFGNGKCFSFTIITEIHVQFFIIIKKNILISNLQCNNYWITEVSDTNFLFFSKFHIRKFKKTNVEYSCRQT